MRNLCTKEANKPFIVPSMTSKITVVATTNRPNSLTAQVADHYTALLQEMGCASQVLKLTALPDDFAASTLYDKTGANPAYDRVKAVMESAQKYVFIVPEYNGSFPGVFKTLIDGLDFPHTFQGKKCAMVGVSKGPQGAAFAMSHLTDIFHYLKMHVYPLKPRLANIHDNQLTTILAHARYVAILQEQVAGFLDY